MSATWDALIDVARTESVDAIIIAGDLIDRENPRFEPVGPIERGLTTLARHNIPVVIVAGDDDVGTLRTLVENDATGTLQVLGQDGIWETTTVTGDSSDTLTIAGWSAPGRSISGSPVANLNNALGNSDPDVVVLHGTPKGSAGGFAPIPTAHMTDNPASLWIAGAPFAPDVNTIDGTTVLVPGSAAALSPDDTGTRGAWIADIDGRKLDLRQIPLAAVRFDQLEIDLTGCGDIDAAESRIIGELQATLETAVTTDAGNNLLAICVHLIISGRTPAFAALPAQLEEISRTIDLQQRGVVLTIASVTNNMQPNIELESLAQRADPVGETARILQALDAPALDDMPVPYQDLVRRTVTRLSSVHRSRVFAAVSGDPEPGVDAARSLLRREAWATLNALVQQRGIDQEGYQGQ